MKMFIMINAGRVSLKFFAREDLSGVRYDLDEFQSKYTSSASFALNRIARRNTGQEFAVTVFCHAVPAGFFTLDFGEDKLELTGNQKSVLLRSLSVNPAMQGKGIGKAVMAEVEQFLRQHFKDCDEIVLAVNTDNIFAYDLYLKAGYLCEGKTREGRNGLQYLMAKRF